MAGLAFHLIGGQVVLQSRQQRPLTPYFPEITVAIAAQVPAGTVLDGELVVYRGGRCDFAALQQRISARPGSQDGSGVGRCGSRSWAVWRRP